MGTVPHQISQASDFTLKPLPNARQQLGKTLLHSGESRRHLASVQAFAMMKR